MKNVTATPERSLRQKYATLAAMLGLISWQEWGDLKHDDWGVSMSIGYWVGLVVGSIVLLFIVAQLLPTLNQALFNYSNNETIFGPIMKILVPLLIGAGILLFFVAVYLRQFSE